MALGTVAGAGEHPCEGRPERRDEGMVLRIWGSELASW